MKRNWEVVWGMTSALMLCSAARAEIYNKSVTDASGTTSVKLECPHTNATLEAFEADPPDACAVKQTYTIKSACRATIAHTSPNAAPDPIKYLPVQARQTGVYGARGGFSEDTQFSGLAVPQVWADGQADFHRDGQCNGAPWLRATVCNLSTTSGAADAPDDLKSSAVFRDSLIVLSENGTLKSPSCDRSAQAPPPTTLQSQSRPRQAAQQIAAARLQPKIEMRTRRTDRAPVIVNYCGTRRSGGGSMQDGSRYRCGTQYAMEMRTGVANVGSGDSQPDHLLCTLSNWSISSSPASKGLTAEDVPAIAPGATFEGPHWITTICYSDHFPGGPSWEGTEVEDGATLSCYLESQGPQSAETATAHCPQ